MDKTIEKFWARRDARMKERMDAKFEENDHPRDENGRFTSGGGSSGGSNKAERGGVEKNRQERGGVARKMSKSGEIPQDVMGQLDSHNYSDEIIDRAVERKWITKEQAQKIRSGSSGGKKTEAASARERMVERTKGKAYPTPTKLDVSDMHSAYQKAVDGGDDPVDVLKGYTRAHDAGADMMIGGTHFKKVGENKWQTNDPGEKRSESGIETDRDIAMRLSSAFYNKENVDVSKGEKKESRPRPRTKLELMKDNKERYAKVQEEIKGMKPGLERDVKEKVVLPWIKGENWMGGLSDRKAEAIYKKMPYSFEEIQKEFERQMDKY